MNVALFSAGVQTLVTLEVCAPVGLEGPFVFDGNGSAALRAVPSD
jgi:hypothetical protein